MKWKVLTCALLFCSCATFSKERGHEDVAKLVKERSGRKTSWEKGSPDAKKINAQVNRLLHDGLTRERAIEIALANNPELQATYAELDISQGELVEAGRLANPTLSGSVGFPIKGGGRLEYEASLVQSFLDLLLLPLRSRMARKQFIADTLRVSHEALRVAFEVSKALAEVQAQDKLITIRRTFVQSTQLAADLARRQHDAGNITALALVTEQAMYQQARLDLAHAELELLKSREALNRLLGLWGAQTDWTLARDLAHPPQTEPPMEQLEQRAVRQRLDIAAARQQVMVMDNALSLARTSRYLGMVEVGVHIHQDPDGPRLLGPTLSLELPIFNQRQGLIARLEAQRAYAERRLMALSVHARSEVRVASTELLTERQVVDHYRTTLLPLRERAVEEAQLQYNAMQIGLYELVAAKQAHIDANEGYYKALRDYWIARAELERAMGGSIERPMRNERKKQ